MATESDSLTSFATASLSSAMQRLMLDPDHADLTVTCGDKEWKVHSSILAVRSPFFKAAITTNMVEKLEMKIDIVDFDPEAMEEVLNFMYGIPKKNCSAKFLFEAAERFQMEDLKEYAIMFARKEMSVANVVELGHAAELYSTEAFLGECANFIVKNKVPLTDEDISPKLAVMVVTILKDDIQSLNDVNQKLYDTNQELKGKLQDSEDGLKVFLGRSEVEWRLPHNIHLNGQLLEYDGPCKLGFNVASAQAKTQLTTSSHYFEVKIIDSGPGIYVEGISIGLARKDYHWNWLPGWFEGSIGYHANDGRVYMGSGGSSNFGTSCLKGDIIGCGVIFNDSKVEVSTHKKTVDVYFTKNGSLLGKKEMVVPVGGFYPTVGMSKRQQKVSVEFKLNCN